MSETPLIDFGGTGPVLNIAVANGFPPQTYAPLITPLTAAYHVVALPPRALWQGGESQPPKHFVSWRDGVTRDLLDGFKTHSLHEIIGVGHSLGAIATMLAHNAAPERFKAVILLEPTLLSRTQMRVIRLAQFLHYDRVHFLARRTDKRRHIFEDRAAALAYFQSKRIFADWSPQALQGYVDSLHDLPDGTVTLGWPREWEAYYYRTLYTYAWKEIPKLRGSVPVLVIRGSQSDTFSPESATQMRRLLPQADYIEIEGHGHLFPFSAPELAAGHIADWLTTLSSLSQT